MSPRGIGVSTENLRCFSTGTAVRKVLRGETYLAPAFYKDDFDFLRQRKAMWVDRGERLTDRQREVLQLLAEGKSMKEVGSILGMTPRTVAFHKYRMMDMLRAKNGTDLVKYAIAKHLTAA
jgi:DNA-binding CsgD family transcriptional regulator